MIIMFRLVPCFFAFLFLFGCASIVESQLDSVRNDFMTGSVKETDLKKENNLDLLITADKLFHANEYEKSDTAYEEFNKRNLDTTSGSLTRETTQLLVGAIANDYKPYMMDSLFVSYYQLWSALATGRYDDARVIINQSYARQQDMSIAYQKTLEENQKALSNESELAQKINFENSVWTAYRDIMNPALMYLSGIYFLNNGDFSDALTYLERANGMVPGNSFVATDLVLSQTDKRPKNTVWVFIEDGFAPKLHEESVSLPVLVGGGTSFVTVAMSQPVFTENFTSIDGAKKLADVDAMFMTEYKEYRANDIIRALSSATARLALQTSMYNSHSSAAPLMGLASNIFSIATSNAEVRTWVTLPKTISVFRTDNNKSGLIELRSNGNIVTSIPLNKKSGNFLVYVRIGPNSQDVKVIKLK